MGIEIIGSFDKDKVYCTGSFTKLLTTYVSLSLLSKDHHIQNILDDNCFFDEISKNNKPAKDFLNIFQTLIGKQFSLHDICTYYAGLPYTFDVSKEEILRADLGCSFKHHSVLDKKAFLYLCKNCVTPVYTNQCKFHYSEISIIFLGYFLELVYGIKIEDLYQEYIFDSLKLKNSTFSRKIPQQAYVQDLSDKYDYPSIAIVDHGYFCYSNSFYTTLNDMKILLESLIEDPIFNHYMINLKNARAASNRLMNGLTIEIRIANNDLLYGYEGLSFSGCNLWAYSTKYKQGYLIFSSSEEEVYDIIYNQILGYSQFDIVPAKTQKIYKDFLRTYHYSFSSKDIPLQFQGEYHRVKINAERLNDIFTVGKNFIHIRSPEMTEYPVVYENNHYWLQGKDKVHGSKIAFQQSSQNNYYFSVDGVLYKKILK